MISRRKLRREALRLLRQATSAPRLLTEFLFATWWHDRISRPRQVRTQGDVPQSAKIAIYLIYPRHGLLDTHVESLRYILSRGYSPVTVCNVFLSQKDRKRLAGLSYRIIERENVGYDFGGYREGVLSIAGDLPALERLVLLNDSCWFPLPGSQDWLSLAESAGLDYVGAASNYGIDAPEIDRFRELDWRYDSTRHSFHYCSFALSLSSRIARDPKFLRFWRRYRLSNQKSRTVRRGEIGLTQWAIRQGYSHGSAFTIDRLDHDLDALDSDRLKEIVNDLVIPEHVILNDKIEELIGEANTKGVDRRTLEKIILTAVASQGMAYSIPQYLIDRQAYSFLKKSPIRLDPRASRKTFEIIDRLGDAGWAMKLEAEAMFKEGVSRDRVRPDQNHPARLVEFEDERPKSATEAATSSVPHRSCINIAV